MLHRVSQSESHPRASFPSSSRHGQPEETRLQWRSSEAFSVDRIAYVMKQAGAFAGKFLLTRLKSAPQFIDTDRILS
jgi:hypothetical protein